MKVLLGEGVKTLIIADISVKKGKGSEGFGHVHNCFLGLPLACLTSLLNGTLHDISGTIYLDKILSVALSRTFYKQNNKEVSKITESLFQF